ncbi:SRPBCC family protein [Paenibacillus sp. 2TAB19]|uniref:SRPBCC family protein n=1 Tax=Paenibacillus sp. 2TAB19 TaxID=3233003 RepID=UPI003F9945A7
MKEIGMFKKKETTKLKSKAKGNILMLERSFDAPRELVFQAYTEAAQLVLWWGPRDWNLTLCNVDLQPGGAWQYCLEFKDGQTKSWGKAIYREIAAPDKLVYEDYISDENGVIEANDGLLVTVTFEDVQGKTKLTNRVEFVSSGALKRTVEMGLIPSMDQTWSRLAEHLRGLQA